MKTYPLNNSDIDNLKSFKSAFESYKQAQERGDVSFINSAYNWLQSQWFDVGTGLRKSGFDVSNTEMRHDKQRVYNHIVALNL